MRRVAVMGLTASVCVSSACGYAPMTGRGLVPGDVDRIYVEAVAGTKGDPEIADALARELREVMRRDGRFAVTSDRGRADAVLRVDLLASVSRPVAFDEFDDPLDYETTVSVDASLARADGVMLWSAKRIGATRAHAAVAGAVVTSSSAFVSSERLRARDLAAFDTVQLGEERLVHARATIAADIAATVYLRMMEGR